MWNKNGKIANVHKEGIYLYLYFRDTYALGFKCTSSVRRLTWVQIPSLSQPGVWLWATHFTLQSLNFLIYNRGNYSYVWVILRIQERVHAKCLARYLKQDRSQDLANIILSYFSYASVIYFSMSLVISQWQSHMIQPNYLSLTFPPR